MSTPVSILIGFALAVAVFAPLAVAYWRPSARLPVAAVYGLLLSGLAVHHAGLSFAHNVAIPTANAEGPLPAAASDELTRRCTEALQLAGDNGMFRDRSDPSRVVVDRAVWNQVPDLVRQAIVRCLELSRPAGQTGTVEIVQE